MPAATRKGDLSTGHSCFPPTAITITDATKTYINGKLAAILDAVLVPHRCGKTVHFPNQPRKVISGSNKVYIEGKKAIRIGDDINCGDTVGQGSNNTFFG